MRARNRWGWGFEDAAISTADARAAAPGLVALLGFGETEPEEPVAFETVELPAARLVCPPHLRGVCTDDEAIRASHARGQSYLDTVRGLRGRFGPVPDLVARPRDEREIEDVLEWAGGANAAVVPYGGGTSVVGGVEPRVPDRFDGVVTVDMQALDALREVDPVSRAARIGAGASGPRLEEQLAAHGLTLRFFPQSFELSTLGGWIATRAGGHFATHLTHIDDLVESVRAVGPAGHWVSRRLPGSGAGPSPDRLLLGSEGILGVITEAWVRVRPRPAHRAGRAVRFDSFLAGAEAVRAVAQSELHPANCRLIDALEAAQSGIGDGTEALLTLGFESADHPVDAWLERALAICREHGGRYEDDGAGDRALGSWREAFLRMPYLRPARAPRRLHRHVRVGGDLGALPGLPRLGHRGGARGARRALPRHVPADPRLSRRAGAVLHRPRARAPRRRGGAVARDEGGRRPGDPRGGRHHPPPPPRRTRPPPVVRRAAAGRLRRRAARRQARARPGGSAQSRGADRSLAAAAAPSAGPAKKAPKSSDSCART